MPRSSASARPPRNTPAGSAPSRRCRATAARTRWKSNSTTRRRRCSRARPRTSVSRRGPRHEPPVRRCSTTEGTYPYHRGGVSTWCHALTTELAEIDFTVLAITMHPYLEPQYPLAPNVQQGDHRAALGHRGSRRVRPSRVVPRLPAAPLEHDAPGRRARLRAGVRERFSTSWSRPALGPRALGLTLLRMHQFYRRFDYQRTLAQPEVWNTFVAVTQRGWRRQHPDEPPAVGRRSRSRPAQLLHRLMLPLAVDAPQVDLTHSAAAAFCGLPCIMSKLRWNTPYPADRARRLPARAVPESRPQRARRGSSAGSCSG